MEEEVHDPTMKLRQKRESMTTTSKTDVEGYFIMKTNRENSMYTILNKNISLFYGKWEGMFNEGIYKILFTRLAERIINLSFIYLSMVVIGCGVS